MPVSKRQLVVLVVDDEAAVRRLTRRVLEQDGYAVIDAAQGAAAVDAWRDCRNTVDLVILDVPANGAGEFMDAIKTDSPATPILLMSTFPDGKPAEAPFLRKPFGAEELQTMVAGMIGQSSSASEESA